MEGSGGCNVVMLVGVIGKVGRGGSRVTGGLHGMWVVWRRGADQRGVSGLRWRSGWRRWNAEYDGGCGGRGSGKGICFGGGGPGVAGSACLGAVEEEAVCSEGGGAVEAVAHRGGPGGRAAGQWRRILPGPGVRHVRRWERPKVRRRQKARRSRHHRPRGRLAYAQYPSPNLRCHAVVLTQGPRATLEGHPCCCRCHPGVSCE